MSVEQMVRQSIHNSAKAIIKELGEKLGVEFDQNAQSIIAELTYKRLLIYGSDLEAFQKHAKRSTITADDVKLLVRRNDSLREIMENKLNKLIALKPPADVPNTTKRKRK